MKYTKILSFFASIAFLTSCQDAIYVNPGDEVTDSNAITSVSDAQKAVYGVYATVSGADDIELSAYVTDECTLGATNNGQGVSMHSWNYVDNEDDVAGYWGSNYAVIARVNTTYQRIEALTPANATEVNTLNRLKGELLALRAYAHFNLLKIFSTSYTDLNALAVAYVDRPIVTEKLPRNTVGEVYNRISEDLASAKLLLNNNSSTDNIFVTKNAVTAMQARVALYKKDYANAIVLANELIATNKYALATSSNFSAIWGDSAADTESIFKLKRVAGNGRIGTIFTASDGATDYFVPSAKYLKSLDASDVRLTTYINTSANRVNKYPGVSGNIYLNDIKLYRFSEILFIKAEALANQGQLSEASTIYNSIRKSRQSTFVDVTFASLSDANDALLEERFREFAFEGHRFFDLKRLGKDIVRDNDDCSKLLNLACTLSSSNYRFTMPIPSAETFVNPGLVQNPGY